jgi:hypothetical protein
MWIKTIRDLKEIVNRVPERDLDCTLVGDALEDGGGALTHDIWVDKDIYHGGEWIYRIALILDKEEKEIFEKDWEWDRTFSDEND